MEKTTLHIKNMVCNRCVKVVRTELEQLGLNPEPVSMGEAVLNVAQDQVDQERIAEALAKHGFELLRDKRATLIEKIKNIIIRNVHHQEKLDINYNFSSLIEEHMHMDYSYLSTLFSSSEGITIEKYIILQKIERVKELLVYGELTLSEIAWKLGYKSVPHLSAQFKKVTGLTPSAFKQLNEYTRKPLDEI